MSDVRQIGEATASQSPVSRAECLHCGALGYPDDLYCLACGFTAEEARAALTRAAPQPPRSTP